MVLDLESARALGWPKLTYAALELERRWLCSHIPAETEKGERITDIYITGTRLRLREAVPLSGDEPIRRLTRKADVNAATRLLTSIYLSASEFELFAGLPGAMIRKTRHRLVMTEGLKLSIDRFEYPCEGLLLAEAEFADEEAMAAYEGPDFATEEVTTDSRYTGISLALHGIPVPN